MHSKTVCRQNSRRVSRFTLPKPLQQPVASGKSAPDPFFDKTKLDKIKRREGFQAVGGGQRDALSGLSPASRGQTILEFLAMLALLIFSLKGGLLLLWILTGRLYLDHQLYQLLVCRAKGQTENICSARFLKESRKFVLKGKITDIKISRQRRLYKGSLIWNVTNLKIPVRQTFKTP